jgi:hypothetical protein
MIIDRKPVRPVIATGMPRTGPSGHSTLSYNTVYMKPVRHVAGTGMPRKGPKG